MIRTRVAVSELQSVASPLSLGPKVNGDRYRNHRWCEKPSRFLLACARENSPEAIVLMELGNLRDPTT